MKIKSREVLAAGVSVNGVTSAEGDVKVVYEDNSAILLKDEKEKIHSGYAFGAQRDFVLPLTF